MIAVCNAVSIYFGGTELDVVYCSIFEGGSVAQMRHLHDKFVSFVRYFLEIISYMFFGENDENEDEKHLDEMPTNAGTL